jgi:hypothetical protein
VGITIVAGDEMAEKISDQFPSAGSLDSGGAENALCADMAYGQNIRSNRDRKVS